MEQIPSQLVNWIGWNVFAVLLIPLSVRWPKVARAVFSLLFFGAGPWNLFASLTMPAFYLETYGPLATPLYAAFIYGPFASNPALFVVPIAIGELVLGVLVAGTGPWVRLGMIGITIFMIGLAPLGVGGAFPFSVLAIVAAYLLFRRHFETSLLVDVRAMQGALARQIP